MTVVKECLNAAAETLLEGKQRDELREKIKQIPMWAATTTRKPEMLSDDALMLFFVFIWNVGLVYLFCLLEM